MKPAEDLCRSCGMCCDGTLFDLVRLEPGDDARRLAQLGLPIAAARGQQAARFPQPCAALCADGSCRLYADRPGQCRAFECGLLREAKAGRVSFAAAARRVTTAKRRANQVRRLLRALGDNDEQRALGERFHRTSERLEAGSADPAASALYADLSLAVHRLKLEAHTHFHTPPAAAPAAGTAGKKFRPRTGR